MLSFVLASAAAARPVGAYEYVSGGGQSCPTGREAVINAYVYGDWNIYSDFGLEGFMYNVPFNQLTYAYVYTGHQNITASAAEAENYVDGPVGTACEPV